MKQQLKEAKQQLKEMKEGCLEGTAKLAEVFPDMPLRKVKWALAKAGGDVEVAASELSVGAGLMKRKREEKEAFMLKADALSQRLNEAGCPRGPWRVMQLLKKTGGDIEAAVKIVQANVELCRSKGKGALAKGKGWQHWAAWNMGAEESEIAPDAADDTSSSSSDSDSEV